VIVLCFFGADEFCSHVSVDVLTCWLSVVEDETSSVAYDNGSSRAVGGQVGLLRTDC